jgi:erythromycin esterase-like protein
VRMLSRVDTALRTRAQRTVDCVAPGRSPDGTYNTARYQGATTLAVQTACVDSLQALLSTVETARPTWTGRMPADDLDWLVQYVRLVWQWARLGRATSDAYAVRDQAMAENLGWIAAREPTARLFAWAHNGHVTRRAPAMGSNLARAFGAEYRNVAFTFGTGTFNAYGSTGATLTTLAPQTIAVVPPWSLESPFQASTQPRLIFDARRIAAGGDAAASLRNQPLRMRSIGAVYAESSPASYFEQMRIPEDYDGLIWFATTSPSVLLPFIR